MQTRACLGVSKVLRTTAVIASATLISSVIAQPVLYVDDDAGPGGSGGSWATAYTHLQDALLAAAGSGGSVTEIRVAGGVYTTDSSAGNPGGTGSRSATFSLVANTALRGGYAGSLAANGDDRDLITNETVLSGEIGAGGNADNSYHVLMALSVGGPVTVDGFTVSGGNANNLSSSNDKRGGGFYLFNGVGNVSDCTFTGNYGNEGGGVHANFGTVSIEGSTFDANSSKYGGGVMASSAHTTITDSSFNSNSASSSGGALRRAGASGYSLTISGCEFNSNIAGVGGAIELFANFPGVEIDRSVFSGNIATHIGGAIANLSEGMSATNSLFEGNSAASFAGAIGTNFNGSGTGPNIINCTVVNNSAASGGGIISLSSSGSPLTGNCVLWGNSDNTGSGESAQLNLSPIASPAGTLTLNNVIMGLAAGGVFDSGFNTGNTGDDPLFADESLGDFHLSVASGAIDTGDDSLVAGGVGALDLDGLARIVDGDFDTTATVDRGAYEFVSLDSDGDGLDDVDEIALGTNPLDPDTDADGLLDGTEVDSALGSGCPDPLTADSDGDGLNDGDEVLLGTNPCLADTDGDGVNDFDDPTPTVPGVTTGFMEDAARDTADAVETITLSTFTGPNNNANSGRQNSLSSRLSHAANLIASGDTAGAIDQLTTVLVRVDGDPQPKDWIAAGPEQEDLKAQIELLISLLLL